MLTIAAVLLVVLALAHSILGERFILMRLFRRGDMPKVLGSADFTKNTLRFVWHLTSVMGIGIAAVLAQAGNGAAAPPLVATLGWTTLLAGLLPLFFTRGSHLSWIGLIAAGLLCLAWATR